MITRINDETQREEREIISNLLRSFQPPQGQQLQEGQEEQEQIELNSNNNLSCPSFDPSIELLTSGNTSTSSSSSASSQMNPSNFQKNIINNRNRFSSNNSSSFLQFKIIKELERRIRHVNSSSDLYYFIEYCDYNTGMNLRRHTYTHAYFSSYVVLCFIMYIELFFEKVVVKIIENFHRTIECFARKKKRKKKKKCC
jgi:hypothetical protein